MRAAVYDSQLQIGTYRFEGIVQPFPKHFHEYYVIGFAEEGERILCCKDKEYMIGKGSILLLNRGNSHRAFIEIKYTEMRKMLSLRHQAVYCIIKSNINMGQRRIFSWSVKVLAPAWDLFW